MPGTMVSNHCFAEILRKEREERESNRMMKQNATCCNDNIFEGRGRKTMKYSKNYTFQSLFNAALNGGYFTMPEHILKTLRDIYQEMGFLLSTPIPQKNSRDGGD